MNLNPKTVCMDCKWYVKGARLFTGERCHWCKVPTTNFSLITGRQIYTKDQCEFKNKGNCKDFEEVGFWG